MSKEDRRKGETDKEYLIKNNILRETVRKYDLSQKSLNLLCNCTEWLIEKLKVIKRRVIK